ncbi:MAG: hypothetical protein PF637_00495 [Spirochaetes bacterium]|jgi:vacuolar-type H+-ATPase subunit H|nr:hypothetical protein [Spirochaetota bacterium]
MKEILQDILLAEKEAEKIIRDAQTKASQMTRDTEIDISSRKTQLKETTRKLIQDRVDSETAKEELSDSNGFQALSDVSQKQYNHVKEQIKKLICETRIDGEN